jgi:nucleoid-associated protein YgaU
MADQLEQLKQKYQSVIDTAKQLGVQLQHVNMSGEKLYIQGIAPSEDAKNKVWDRIKQIDPGYSDLTVDFSVSPQAQTAQAAAGGGGQERTYTIQPGDTLSGISQRFYGKASEYGKILDANRDKIKDADHIRSGETITIP